MMRILAGVALLVLSASAGAATADEIPVYLRGHWKADSTTASGITGNIIITPSEIIFQNDAHYGLLYLGKSAGISPYDNHIVSDIFRVRDPRILRLLGQNTLCGAGTIPRYVAFDIENDRIMGTRLDMTVTEGKVPPSNKRDSNHLCATFSFVPGRSAPH
jgi:hypothetical protein